MKIIKNKKASFQLTIPLIIILFLIFAFAFGWFKTGSIVTFGEKSEDEIRTISCLGTTCELTAPYFGSLTSGTTGVTIDGTTSYGSGWNICGDNDGKVSVASSFSTNGNLVLTSSGYGYVGCNNYIKAKLTLPAGTLKVKCDLSATDNEDWGASSSCKVSGLISEKVVSQGAPPRFWIDGGTKTKTISREIILDKETDLEVTASGNWGSHSGNSFSSRITLEFIPLPVEEAEEIIEEQGGEITILSEDETYVAGSENIQELNWFQKLWNWIIKWLKT